MDEPIRELFQLMREAQAIKQRDLGKVAGISQPLLSQFENGQVPLSKDKLLRMAHFLGINPAFLDDSTSPPFGDQKLFKMFFSEHLISGMDYSPLERLVELMRGADILFLMGTSKSEIMDRMVAKTIIGQFTQAALIRDNNGNLFIFRRKRRGAYLVGEMDLQARLREKALMEGKVVRFASTRIPRELSRKINDLTVEREDVEGLFAVLKNAGMSLDDAIIDKVMSEIKEGHNPKILLTVLQEQKARGMDDQDLLELIRSSKK